MTRRPDGTVVCAPFPDYEKEVPTTGSSTRRVTFSANGQVAVARKKVGSGAAALYSLHTDQLGNVAAVANSAGVYVTDSYAMYEPFGAFLLRPTATNPSVSDRGFTGHQQNNTGTYDFGLIYMNARYYHPQLGRFVSPDTIIPEPSDPQSYNRYSYGFNNPVKYSDQSGHCGAEVVASNDDPNVGYDEFATCLQLRSELESILGHPVLGIWYLWQMRAMHQGGFALVNEGITLNAHMDREMRRGVLQHLTEYWAGTEITSLEISARVVEFGSIIGANIEDLIAVLSGHVDTGIDGLFYSEEGPHATIDTLSGRNGNSGFNPTYADPYPANNQVHHIWYWIQVAYYRNDIIAYAGNYYHERIQRNERGQSQQDYDAGLWGIDVGSQLQNGDLSLRELAMELRVDLGR